MEDHDDFAFEPIPGLPDQLPAGEALLWQGSPDWRALARSAFHVRKVAVYFGIVLVWRFATTGDMPLAAQLSASAWIVLAALASLGILHGLAFLYARGTIYTLTTRRIVIRSGIALPVTFNLPLALVESAAVTHQGGSVGSIALTVAPPNRVAFLVLWPNARPWHVNKPQPMLRCLRDVEAVARVLTATLAAEAGPLSAWAPRRGHAASPPATRPADQSTGQSAGQSIAI
ncbi:hypothetical protein Sa4125_27610 [Aureimonas sp. SA4125]|uniref:photosynthetic complex putative assembly protein PuhB n=1 Tax=Aureimonas sp. SA4125 TaxID=2826993 RepID=UPI001CC804FD|nr:photosynthetic complex putative assembly protein PuhB [Aureimonas sp. SA4125]BDA85219.1 hypothetical protein Sa4125_27610 [Aureimonas sp. SA4125]